MMTRPPFSASQPPGLGQGVRAWARDEEERLRTLREAARLEETAFAKRHAISVAQLRALEGRGTCPFYSEAIKARLGARLLASLERTYEDRQGADARPEA